MAKMESLTQSRFIKYKERLKEKTNFSSDIDQKNKLNKWGLIFFLGVLCFDLFCWEGKKDRDLSLWDVKRINIFSLFLIFFYLC